MLCIEDISPMALVCDIIPEMVKVLLRTVISKQTNFYMFYYLSHNDDFCLRYDVCNI
jgi:hypothetical protein